MARNRPVITQEPIPKAARTPPHTDGLRRTRMRFSHASQSCSASGAPVPAPPNSLLSSAIVFSVELIFAKEKLYHRILHNDTAHSIQRELQFAGLQTVILPIRVQDAA
jgi:hypothetical protein